MKTVIVVDDQEEIRMLVEIALRVGDYQVLQAESGEEAVDIAKEERPDLIIMDIMMLGHLDRLEDTKVLKNDQETRDIIIIMLTARTQETDLEKGYQAGADDYFIKPFSPLELIRKVEEVLE